MLQLRYQTPEAWTAVVLDNFDLFLQDHAANERKVHHSAIMLAVRYPAREDLVAAMIELAQEEFAHFLEVYRLLTERGVGLGQDLPDQYMGDMFRLVRRGDANFQLMDQLLLFSIVEARGCERFRMLGEALEPGSLRDFYRALTASEAKHHSTYLQFARDYYDEDVVAERLDLMLDTEAAALQRLKLRPALH